MGEFLGAFVAIPSIRMLGIVGPYESMACSFAAPDKSSSVILGPVFLLRPHDSAKIQSDRLVASLTVFCPLLQTMW
jgi:hypothetical protein